MNSEKYKVLKYFYPYVVPYKKIILLNLITVSTISILGIISPLLFRLMFNEVFPSRNIQLFFIIAFVGFFIEFAHEVLIFIRDYVDLFVTQKIQHKLRRDVFQKFENLSIDYYTSTSTGDHLWTLTNDITKIQEMVSSNLPKILQTLMEFSLLVVLAFWIDWKLSLLALTIIPMFVANAFFHWIK